MRLDYMDKLSEFNTVLAFFEKHAKESLYDVSAFAAFGLFCDDIPEILDAILKSRLEMFNIRTEANTYTVTYVLTSLSNLERCFSKREVELSDNIGAMVKFTLVSNKFRNYYNEMKGILHL